MAECRQQMDPDIVDRHEERIVEALCACVVELARAGCMEPATRWQQFGPG